MINFPYFVAFTEFKYVVVDLKTDVKCYCIKIIIREYFEIRFYIFIPLSATEKARICRRLAIVIK